MTEDLHHLAGAYALNALDADEREAFEAHYQSCDICTQEVRDFQATAANLADGASEAPPSSLKAKVMGDIAQVRQDGPVVIDELAARRSSKSSRPALLLAAAAALIVLGGLVGIQLNSADSGTADLLAAPDAVVTTLDGSVGNLQLVWSAERDEVALIGSGLADLDDEQIYELWFLLDDGVAPATLFRTSDGSINEVFSVDDIDGTGFGVTVEPAEGSEVPTSDVIYVAMV